MSADMVGEAFARQPFHQRRLYVHRGAVAPPGARLEQQRQTPDPPARLGQRVGERERVGGDEGVMGRRRPRAISERSEEHTSELQSLMRISYAVFCLKKKNTKALYSNKKK